MKRLEIRPQPAWEGESEKAGLDLSGTHRGIFRAEKASPLSAEACFWLGLVTLLEKGALSDLFNLGGG